MSAAAAAAQSFVAPPAMAAGGSCLRRLFVLIPPACPWLPHLQLSFPRLRTQADLLSWRALCSTGACDVGLARCTPWQPPRATAPPLQTRMYATLAHPLHPSPVAPTCTHAPTCAPSFAPRIWDLASLSLPPPAAPPVASPAPLLPVRPLQGCQHTRNEVSGPGRQQLLFRVWSGRGRTVQRVWPLPVLAVRRRAGWVAAAAWLPLQHPSCGAPSAAALESAEPAAAWSA